VAEAGRLVEVVLPRVDVRPSVSEPTNPAEEDRSGVTAGISAAGSDATSNEALRWARELGDYFRGLRRGWNGDDIRLDSFGFTPFRAAVYRALLEVPAGSTITYGELARAAGRPGAARAVGSAMAENPIAIVIPCHRVVRNDGSLGRYGFGAPWKPFLLQLEGARE
jgi:O-6-methylguanine DNA methyltransferase